jgi:hypothetical protein
VCQSRTAKPYAKTRIEPHEAVVRNAAQIPQSGGDRQELAIEIIFFTALGALLAL